MLSSKSDGMNTKHNFTNLFHMLTFKFFEYYILFLIISIKLSFKDNYAQICSCVLDTSFRILSWLEI